MQLEHGEAVGHLGHCLLDRLAIVADHLLPAGLDLRDDREAVARGSLGKDRAVPPLFHLALKNPPFGIAMAAGFVQSFCMGTFLSFFLLLFTGKNKNLFET